MPGHATFKERIDPPIQEKMNLRSKTHATRRKVILSNSMRLRFVVPALFVLSTSLYAQSSNTAENDVSGRHKNMAAKALLEMCFAKLKAISAVSFTLNDPFWRGTCKVTLATGGQARIEYSGGFIVSTPKGGWQVDLKEKHYWQILADVSRDSVPGFEPMFNLQPFESTGKGPAYGPFTDTADTAIEVSRISNSGRSHGVLFFDSQNSLPSGFTPSNGSTIVYSDMVVNPKIESGSFEWSPPAGWTKGPGTKMVVADIWAPESSHSRAGEAMLAAWKATEGKLASITVLVKNHLTEEQDTTPWHGEVYVTVLRKGYFRIYEPSSGSVTLLTPNMGGWHYIEKAKTYAKLSPETARLLRPALAGLEGFVDDSHTLVAVSNPLQVQPFGNFLRLTLDSSDLDEPHKFASPGGHPYSPELGLQEVNDLFVQFSRMPARPLGSRVKDLESKLEFTRRPLSEVFDTQANLFMQFDPETGFLRAVRDSLGNKIMEVKQIQPEIIAQSFSWNPPNGWKQEKPAFPSVRQKNSAIPSPRPLDAQPHRLSKAGKAVTGQQPFCYAKCCQVLGEEALGV